jgi:hypothetical protein
VDFENPTQAPQYLKAALDYCLEGWKLEPNAFVDSGGRIDADPFNPATLT